MSNASLIIGDNRFATKQDKVLGYKILPSNKYSPIEGDGERASYGTYIARDGLLKTAYNDVIRTTFSDPSSPALLLEPQSTNLITWSEDFSQWAQNNGSIQQNIVTSPDGSLNASKFVENTELSTHQLYIPLTVSAEDNQCVSVFIKPAGRTKIRFDIGYSSSTGGMYFDMITKEFRKTSDVSSLITDWGYEDLADGWIRIYIGNESNILQTLRINLVINDTSTTYQGDGVSGIYVWGGQAEDSVTKATSYIKTEGSTVTRAGDVCTNFGTVDDFNSEEGVIDIELALMYGTLNRNDAFYIGDGTPTNQIILKWNASNGRFSWTANTGGVGQVTSFYTVPDIFKQNKYTVSYKQDEVKMYLNGELLTTIASYDVPIINTFNELSLSNDAGFNSLYSKTKAVKVYKSISSAIDDGLTYLEQ